MKLRTILLSTILSSFLTISFNSEISAQTNSNDTLIAKLISNFDNSPYKSNGNIYILESEYCDKIDCENYFGAYKDQIQIYALDELFMRGISYSIDIKYVARDNSEMHVQASKQKELKKIKI